ncbi:MAG TPA: hypothetical protein VMU89_05255, partial [Thermomicrobiaceae bacterium]|nr:hypothetical protein [Thermomicrobiaceae bacterium]
MKFAWHHWAQALLPPPAATPSMPTVESAPPRTVAASAFSAPRRPTGRARTFVRTSKRRSSIADLPPIVEEIAGNFRQHAVVAGMAAARAP